MGRGRKFSTSAQALEWMAEEFGDVRSRMDAASLDSLARYKGEGFTAMNGELRDGVVNRFTPEQWLAITDAIASDRLSEPVAVFRGIAFAPLAELLLDGLEEIGHDGFVSVSLLEAVSIGYLSEEPRHIDVARPDAEPANLLLSAALPIGTHVAPIQLVVPASGETGQEAELLLHAGSTFVVEGVDDSDLSCVRVAGRLTAP